MTKYNWTTINHTAKVKGFMGTNDKKTAQAFHKHIQKFIDDNIGFFVSTQRYDVGEMLELE